MRRRREADRFFMGGRECEDGEGERGGGGVKLVFGDGYCWGYRVNSVLVNL